MKIGKQRAKKYGLTVIVFCAVFVIASATRAGFTENLAGWLWGGSDDGASVSSGLGWISVNNINTNGAVSYGVNVPADGGNFSGYAWSENLGYIAFDNSSGFLADCPDGNCAAKRTGNDVSGWARFVEIAKANNVGNSGGWSGWIKLNGIAQDGLAYGVKVKGDGTLDGFAWSDELGYIDFKRTTLPPPPTVTWVVDYMTVDVKTNTLPKAVTLSWYATNAATCDVSSSGNTWVQNNIGTGTLALPLTKNITVPVSGMDEAFTITCHGSNSDATATARIATICYPQECSAALQVCGNTEDAFKIKRGVSNVSSCVAASSCNNDGVCKHKKIDKWMEVSP